MQSCKRHWLVWGFQEEMFLSCELIAGEARGFEITLSLLGTE